jgi:hypothetical protein
MIDRIETNTKPTRLSSLIVLNTTSDARNRSEILFGEDGVIVGEEGRALECRERRREE